MKDLHLFELLIILRKMKEQGTILDFQVEDGFINIKVIPTDIYLNKIQYIRNDDNWFGENIKECWHNIKRLWKI